jgi:hypothetical protein
MTDPNADTPAKPSAEAQFMADERAMIDTLMAGTGAMRAAGEKYLPKSPAESADAYKYRKAVSTLYNGLRRTVEVMAGKPFAEPIELGDDMPAQIVEWCKDVDLQGRDLDAFAHAVFVQALADGVSHILVDYPATVKGATLADKKATGARPYFVHIKQDQILGWRSQRIAGVETLTQLRLMELVTEPAGQWGTKNIEQVRVLEPTTWTTFRKNDRDEWVEFETGEVTLSAIALATVYTGRTGYMQAKPPLLDLAWLNIEHWQSASDQSNILHVARVPILFASGIDEGSSIVIGANAVVSTSNPQAKLSYVEHQGHAIEAGRESLKDLEERMSLMGAQLLVKKPGARTATEKAIDSADADCALKQMVRGLENSIENALQFMADWEQIKDPVADVELTGEIGGLEDMELTALLRCRELGILDMETIFVELQRRGLLNDELQWKDIQARLKAEGTPLAVGTKFEAAGDGSIVPVAAAPGAAPVASAPAAPGSAAPAGPVAPAHAAPDFGPLIDALHTHTQAVSAHTQAVSAPAPAPAAPDFSGMIEAIRAIPPQPAPQITVESPQITVNVPEQPAAQINIAPAAVTVEAPQVNFADGAIRVDAPVTVQPAQITVAQAKPGQIEFTEDAAGNITGATLS